MSDSTPPAPIWARSQEKRRTALSRESIVAAAMALADAEGLKAVSIRQVAAELDARTMSLYSHIESKEDLFDLMADEVAGEILVEGELPEDWREALGMVVRRTRVALLRHPWVVPLMTVRPRVGPNALRHLEQSLAAVKSAGLDLHASVRVIAAVDDYMLGQVIRDAMNRNASRDPERSEAMAAYFRRLMDSGDFPNLAPLLVEGPESDGEESFEQGLKWLLDGIARDHGLRE